MQNRNKRDVFALFYGIIKDMEKRQITAIIAAGGNGKRLSNRLSKQYLPLNKKPILIYSIEKFALHGKIKDVVVVVPEKDMQRSRDLIRQHIGTAKNIRLVAGGQTRQQSVFNGLKHCAADTEIVLIHDAARPFITWQMIDDCLKEMEMYQACSVGVAAINTIKQTDANGKVVKTFDRSTLWEVQTPQCFHFPMIYELHKRAQENNISVTDDCSLAEIYNIDVKMIKGSYENIKITVARDLFTAQGIIKTK